MLFLSFNLVCVKENEQSQTFHSCTFKPIDLIALPVLLWLW